MENVDKTIDDRLATHSHTSDSEISKLCDVTNDRRKHFVKMVYV